MKIEDESGNIVGEYRYDSFGNTTVSNYSGTIGSINLIRWKSYYYDSETGFYYANGRYYEPSRGGYIDAIEADIVEGNAYNVLEIDRNGIMCLTLLMLAPYSATIATVLQLFVDPEYDIDRYTAKEEPPTWWEKHWWEIVLGVVNIVVGVVQLATGNPMGIISIISGVAGIVGACFSEQLAGAIGMAATGAQAIVVGLMSLTCNLAYGIIAMVVGASCVAFGTAEAQESLGYGNWIKDAGVSEGWYNSLMVAANVAAIAVNMVGVKQCFKEGTLVACLNENGEEIRKPIESIAVGTLVLAYDEESGEKAYKPVVQLFRNTTKEWYHVHVNGEEIICTGGHPFYVLNAAADRPKVNYESQPQSAIGAWICARQLKITDKVLLSDGSCATIETIEVEKLAIPQTTYNFEVADFHTYYVTQIDVLVHNACRGKNKLKPNSDAKGPHTTYKRDPITGKITNYATYETNPFNPSGFDEVLRFDGVGGSHAGIPTPHVHIGYSVRPAFPWEIPS